MKKTGFTPTPKNLVRGFTLIEIMVVVFIIGLLASIVTVSVNQSRMRGRDSRRMADLDTIRNAVEMFANQNNGTYPGTSGTTYTSAAGAGWLTAIVTGGILTTSPVDPVATRAYRYRRVLNEYEIDTDLEVGNENEGGNCAARYEIGTNLTLLAC